MATEPFRRLTYMDVEKDIVIELMSKYSPVIENKKSDAPSLNLKVQTRGKLSRQYNSISNVCPRDAKQSKKLWENLKGKWKTAKAEKIRDVFTTIFKNLAAVRHRLMMLPSVKQNWILRIFGTLQLILRCRNELSFVTPIFPIINWVSQLRFSIWYPVIMKNTAVMERSCPAPQ